MKKIAGIYARFDLAEGDIILGNLKRHLLFFDKIGIGRIGQLVEWTREHRCDSRELMQLCNELEYLLESELVFDIDNTVSFTVDENKALPERARRTIPEFLRFLNVVRDDKKDATQFSDAYSRYLALHLNNLDESEKDYFAIPIIEKFELPASTSPQNGDIIKLTIDKFPQPTGQTAWEQIIAFKNNAENLGQLYGLKSWINMIGKSGYTLAEINDELEYKIHQYRRCLEIAKIKYESSLVETIVIGSAEFIENLAKLNLSKAARSFFSAKQAKVNMLQAELSSEGKEAAYIYKAQQKFKI